VVTLPETRLLGTGVEPSGGFGGVSALAAPLRDAQVTMTDDNTTSLPYLRNPPTTAFPASPIKLPPNVPTDRASGLCSWPVRTRTQSAMRKEGDSFPRNIEPAPTLEMLR
jgi:hypothetical protein